MPWTLRGDRDAFLILHDQRSGLDYLRSAADVQARGLELVLDGYRCFVFLGFEVVAGPGWLELVRRIGLEGVADAHEARRRLLDEPIRDAVEALFRDRLVAAVVTPEWATPTPATDGDETEGDLDAALTRLAKACGSDVPVAPVAVSLGDALVRLGTGRRGLVSAAVAGWLVSDAAGAVATGGDT